MKDEPRAANLEQIRSAFQRIVKDLGWIKPFEPHDDELFMTLTYKSLDTQTYLESYPLDVNALSFASKFSQ